MKRYHGSIYLLGLLLGAVPALAGDTGKLSLYRWNKGYRVENQPAVTVELSFSEYRKLLSDVNKLPNHRSFENIYTGCYLARFQKSGRGLASSNNQLMQQTELRKLCVGVEGN